MRWALALLVAVSCSFDSGDFDRRRCDTTDECPLGETCEGGFCVEGCPDRDGDGVGYGTTCAGTVDCDDLDDRRSPETPEEGVGSPSCTDGIDDDCDNLIDGRDPGCV